MAVCTVGIWTTAHAHDIPNARVDRSTQVSLLPGRLRIDYEVSLAELTLTQELRSLIGHLPGGDRAAWFAAYGRETGPLNARGFLVSVDGEERTLTPQGFDLAIEEHPRYTFHFEAPLPDSGSLKVHDTNFMSSEGTSRLGVRGRGVAVRGDLLPPDVESIPARPVWQLDDEEERRTRQVTVEFSTEPPGEGPPALPAAAVPTKRSTTPAEAGLESLLDRASRLSVMALGLLAFGMGAVHAVQPGHGKTLVVAAVLGERGSVTRAVALAVVATLTHTGSVLLVALALWWTSARAFGEVHVVLTRLAGYIMAVAGLWRVGRHLAGFSGHAEGHGAATGGGGLIALGVAGGIVPCWDAVGLIVLAEALGRLWLAVLLVLAFSLGLGVVLAVLGWSAHRFRRRVTGGTGAGAWSRWLGVASGLVLSTLGIYLFVRPVR